MTHYRVSLKLAGSTAWYVSDQHADTPLAALIAHLERRADVAVGTPYVVKVEEVVRADQ